MIGSFGQQRRRAIGARQRGKSDIVAREARAAVSQRAFQIFLPDARVAADRRRHYIHIRTGQRFTNLSQHVGVRDLGGDKGVHRELGQLRVHEVHAPDARVALAHALVKLFQNCAGPLIRLADQDHVRVQHVVNHVAQRDELGVVAKAETRPAFLAR